MYFLVILSALFLHISVSLKVKNLDESDVGPSYNVIQNTTENLKVDSLNEGETTTLWIDRQDNDSKTLKIQQVEIMVNNKEEYVLSKNNKIKNKEVDILSEKNTNKNKDADVLLKKNNLKNTEVDVLLGKNKMENKKTDILLENNKMENKEVDIVLENDNFEKEIVALNKSKFKKIFGKDALKSRNKYLNSLKTKYKISKKTGKKIIPSIKRFSQKYNVIDENFLNLWDNGSVKSIQRLNNGFKTNDVIEYQDGNNTKIVIRPRLLTVINSLSRLNNGTNGANWTSLRHVISKRKIPPPDLDYDDDEVYDDDDDDEYDDDDDEEYDDDDDDDDGGDDDDDDGDDDDGDDDDADDDDDDDESSEDDDDNESSEDDDDHNKSLKPCSIPEKFKHSDIQCTLYDKKVTCQQKCVFGAFLGSKRRTERMQKCSKETGKWKPDEHFRDCKSFLECRIKLLRGDSKCIYNYMRKRPKCYIDCTGKKRLHTHIKHMKAHTCDIHRKWEPKLPSCAKPKFTGPGKRPPNTKRR